MMLALGVEWRGLVGETGTELLGRRSTMPFWQVAGQPGDRKSPRRQRPTAPADAGRPSLA